MFIFFQDKSIVNIEENIHSKIKMSALDEHIYSSHCGNSSRT